MAIKGQTFGEVTVYGTWSDTRGDQFAVIWGEAGDICTVMMFGGCDYGGGITQISSRVPLKRAEQIVHEATDNRNAYDKMGDLVKEFREASYG